MGTKVQHLKTYRPLLVLLRQMREEAGLTQRALAVKLGRHLNYAFYCETAARRVDPAEFLAWMEACGVDPAVGWRRYLKAVGR